MNDRFGRARLGELIRVVGFTLFVHHAFHFGEHRADGVQIFLATLGKLVEAAIFVPAELEKRTGGGREAAARWLNSLLCRVNCI